jgi:acyl-CoA thioesterase-2
LEITDVDAASGGAMTSGVEACRRETAAAAGLSQFLGLAAGPGSRQWLQLVTGRVSNVRGVLFGGCALAAAIEIAEQVTDRPLVTATAQFHAPAGEGDQLTYRAAVGRQGRSVTLLEVTADMAGRRAFTVLAATGSRQPGLAGSWAMPVTAPDPASCPIREHPPRTAGTFFDSIEMRLVTGRQRDELRGSPSAGTLIFWARSRDRLSNSAGFLAMLADAMPSSIAEGLGRVMGSVSLDHSIRIAATQPDPGWVLCELQADRVADGFGHAHGRLWSRDGELLATASQSLIARAHLDQDP